MSKITVLVDKLRDAHLPSLWTALYYAIQPMFHHWIQHCYPDECRAQTLQMDDAIRVVAGICIPGACGEDDVTARRLRLPARLYGGGLRSLEALSPAAFVAAICRAVPRMVDSYTTEGEQRGGFMPPLTSMLGAGSFDDHPAALRFGHLLASGSRLGRALGVAWQALQHEVGEQSPGSILGDPAADAGRNAHRVQAALTCSGERQQHQRLDVDIRALPPTDIRRAAWLNTDRYSTVWVGAWPSPDMWTSSAEFVEIACRYFGLASPACAALVGQRIGAARDTLDAHGLRLCAASLPGDGWRDQHDTIKWRVLEDLREMGMRAAPEVFGLFAPLLPQVARGEYDAMPARKRQGLVPDFLVSCRATRGGPVQETLAELKTLHYGTSTYPASELRCRAVGRRAATIEAEYLGKARSLDRQWLGTAANQQGPVEAKLRGYDKVRGLVFGSWGEASDDVDWLLSQAADIGAVRSRGRRAEEDDTDDLRAVLITQLQRRWGMTALRANARLLLGRLAYVGRGAVAAAARRGAARSSHAANAGMPAWRFRRPRIWREDPRRTLL